MVEANEGEVDEEGEQCADVSKQLETLGRELERQALEVAHVVHFGEEDR